MNKIKKTLTLVVVLCSVQISFGQDVDLTTQNIEIASMNLKEISSYVDEVAASLESGSLSTAEEQLNMEKFKTLTILQQAAADILRELLSQVDVNEADGLVQNAQQVAEIAKQVYTEKVAPTLESVFEMLNDTSDAVATGESVSAPNIYANIGQTPVYQAVMNDLHDTFRQSATTPEGGGFGESDATPN
jgi:transcriptional regulator of heat shock response